MPKKLKDKIRYNSCPFVLSSSNFEMKNFQTFLMPLSFYGGFVVEKLDRVENMHKFEKKSHVISYLISYLLKDVRYDTKTFSNLRK